MSIKDSSDCVQKFNNCLGKSLAIYVLEFKNENSQKFQTLLFVKIYACSDDKTLTSESVIESFPTN